MPMNTRAAVDLRLTRAALFAAVCVCLSAAGHTFASGDTVAFPAMAAGWLAVFTLTALLAGRERSLPGITGVLLGGQLVLHSLFNLGQWHGGHGHRMSQLELLAAKLLCGPPGVPGAGPGTPGTGTRAGAAAVVTPAGNPVTAPFQSSHLAHGLTGPAGGTGSGESCSAVTSSLPMLLGHVAVALIAGWLLHRGETALWSLTQLAARTADSCPFPLGTALALVRALLGGLPGSAFPSGTSVRFDEPPRSRPPLLQHSVSRRGPPGYALAV